VRVPPACVLGSDDPSENSGLWVRACIVRVRSRHLTGDLIGQAKGILMERYNINADRAFAVLVPVSQHNNRKLRDVAEELISSRRLSDLEPRPDAAAT
jgi:ANTAR domain